jgi:hypothetical protein
MRAAFALAAVAFTVLTASASATPLGSATGVATPRAAGAKPAALSVALNLELKCGSPSPAAIVVSLPRAWRVPRAVARSAVWIDQSHPQAVTVSGHTVTLQPTASRGTCDVIGPGTITVKFTQAAKLGNPSKAGRYTIRASIGTEDFSARVSIGPAG